MQQETGFSLTRLPQGNTYRCSTHLPLLWSSFQGPGPKAELGRHETPFPQSLEQGSFWGAFNIQTVPKADINSGLFQ